MYNNHVYLLPNTCILLVCNKYGSDTMHGKCRILRPCNLIDGHSGFGQDILTPTPGGLRRET